MTKYIKQYEFKNINTINDLHDKINSIIGDKYSYNIVVNNRGSVYTDFTLTEFKLESSGELKNIPNHLVHKLVEQFKPNRVEFSIKKQAGIK